MAPLDAVPTTTRRNEACIEGTRQTVFSTIQRWLTSPDLAASKVLWLADISGSGKSAVARHIADTVQDQVLCSFFFKRDIEAHASTSGVIDSLARDLTSRGEPIASEIPQSPKAAGAGYTEAFHAQITVPLCRHPPEQPYLILIDALDESGLSAERADFLAALIHEIPLLPPSVKVLITSKPTQDIADAFNKLSTATFNNEKDLEVYHLTFDVYGQENRRDLGRYITHRFEHIAQIKREEGIPLAENWPSDQQRRSLVAHANGLFLWVTVAANYVDCAADPQQALDQLLALQNRPSPEAAIDALYRHILQAAEGNPDFSLSTYHDLLRHVLASRDPITVTEVNDVLHQDVGPTISCLKPVLSLEPAVRIVHQSFREYVRDPQKCEARFLISPDSPGINTPARRNSFENTIFVGFPLSSLATVASYPSAPGLAPDVSERIVATSVSSIPVARGAFGDIWRAQYKDGKEIAIKSLRVYGPVGALAIERHKLEKRSVKELAIWSQLKHANVLGLLGVCVIGGEIGMVSEWMPNGNVMDYTEKHPEADKLKLITDIAAGLAYLHMHPSKIVHGDLKGINVVISADRTARVVDFGLAKLTEDSLGFSTTTGLNGTIRWMPYELISHEEDSVPTFESDVYALGMEILTGKPPFRHLKRDLQVLAALIKGKRPERPATSSVPEMSDQVWDLINCCWHQDREQRPSTEAVYEMMKRISKSSNSDELHLREAKRRKMG